MDNRAISAHGDDEDGWRGGTKFLTLTPSLRFIPEQYRRHTKADFFNFKREPVQSAADNWKRILEIEKNSEFEEITAAKQSASKLLSVIGKRQKTKTKSRKT